ncbi:Pleckstrin y domain-containing family A member 8 [Liparis tanakae]|uniref:Pleckstrin y domain-containing family A member 8 n=1 Tax=Liparis tanakae TaxID=230148 RepID=A0A4Z2IMI4_9TELE|nr:Pleckstrin y domain-containing family A member 8 [Liparis tanakae]
MEGMLHKWTNYISVHSSDSTRVDLTIPGEQYFYLRAINPAERQKWLVALGTAKACLTDNRTKREKELQENTEALKTKMSELRLYCDLLLQQVNKIKEDDELGDTEETGIDTGNMVKSTCTTFLKTLEECMQIANHTFSTNVSTHSPPGSPPVAAIKPQKIKHVNHLKQNLGEKLNTMNNQQRGMRKRKLAMKRRRNQSSCTNRTKVKKSTTTTTRKRAPANRKLFLTKQKINMKVKLPESHRSRKTPSRFSDIRLDDDNGIPTQEFLDSCYAIVPVLDKLGSTVFAPKINQKLMSDPDSFPTLQSIVLYEVQTDVARVRNSATEALLWLGRGLKFLKEFLSELHAGERDVQGALNKAYGKTLRQYHGWVVRGVFALALRAAPSYPSFAAALVSREGDELKDGFTSGMRRDLGVYLPAMGQQLALLDALYEEYNLESDEVV